MAWETRARGGRYYTRSIRRHGRVYREYIGTGPVAELAAQLEAAERAQRQEERLALARDRQAAEQLEGFVDEVDSLVATLTRLALVSAGFHQHHRGAWRKRRGQEAH